jgi:hypothetical protein
MNGPGINDPRVVLLTPEDATQLLEHNTLNRPLNDSHVKRIANQIINGKWQFNGDTIKISEKGEVLDGQHRLWAILESKMAVKTIIVRGIQREAFATIDTLRKPRSGADVLALNGATRHRQYTSAALQWLTRWQRGVLEQYMAPVNRVENSDVELMYKENPGMERAIERVANLRGLANPSLVGFFYYVLANRNPELAERMVSTLENPAGVSITDPFFRLRMYFTSDRVGRKNPVYTIALMVKAANAAYEGRELKSLAWQNQGVKPESFPKLVVATNITQVV